MGFSLFGKDKQSASDAGTDELEGKATPRRRRKSAEEPVDPVLPEKKRARRRLVGAAAMVLAAVIGLPMLLESEPQPLSDDIQVYIPSIDKPAAEAVAPAESSVVSVTPGEASGQTATPAASSPAPVAQVESAEKPARPVPRTELGKAELSSTQSSRSDSPQAPRLSPSTESERVAQVKALLEGEERAVALARNREQAEQDKYVLQVAALGSTENARELQARLSKSGIKSYTEKVKTDNGEQIRVRVGPFTSREEADKVRSRLSDLGLGGMVMPL